MGISNQCYKNHLAKWTQELSNYRKIWPKYLFRHEPLENAIDIIRSGCLHSRQYAEQNGIIKSDIAPTSVISRTDTAHSNVRLYFRPRNPTQYRIEGIRKQENYYEEKHAGFLVMFVFEAEDILSMSTTKFSCGNMQSSESEIHDQDSGFSNLNFAAIYHDSINYDHQITRQKCAEVLVKDPLNLQQYLKHIIVKTDADSRTLKYLLRHNGLNSYITLVKKSMSPAIFFNQYTALEYIDATSDRLNFSAKATKSSGDIKCQIRLEHIVSKTKNFEIKANISGAKGYYVKHGCSPGQYLATVHLEDCLAHKSILTIV